MAISEVDGRVLVAVPAAAWYKTRRKRCINLDYLQKTIAVLELVPVLKIAIHLSQKKWLGLLTTAVEEFVVPGEGQAEISFPVDSNGVMMVPYAAALVAAARNHFTFLSAQSAVPQVHGTADYESRFAALEDSSRQIKIGKSPD